MLTKIVIKECDNCSYYRRWVRRHLKPVALHMGVVRVPAQLARYPNVGDLAFMLCSACSKDKAFFNKAHAPSFIGGHPKTSLGV